MSGLSAAICASGSQRRASGGHSPPAPPKGHVSASALLMPIARQAAAASFGPGRCVQNGPTVRAANSVRKSLSDTCTPAARRRHSVPLG